MFQNKLISKLLGLIIIGFSVLFFIYLLNNRIKKIENNTGILTSEKFRISADMESDELYLWGAEEGMILSASVPITYKYKEGFYIISIADVEQPYNLEVYEGDKRIAKFRYFSSEKYPIYPD